MWEVDTMDIIKLLAVLTAIIIASEAAAEKLRPNVITGGNPDKNDVPWPKMGDYREKPAATKVLKPERSSTAYKPSSEYQRLVNRSNYYSPEDRQAVYNAGYRGSYRMPNYNHEASCVAQRQAYIANQYVHPRSYSVRIR
jgi:hypothetical protein